MRTVTFSDKRVIELLARRFICVWRNIRPRQKFQKTSYRGIEDSLIKRIRPDDGSDNICAFVATSDGKILHAIQGYQDPDTFVSELEFALTLHALGNAEKRREAYRTRWLEDWRSGSKNAVLRRNLLILEYEPPISLERITWCQSAGLTEAIVRDDPSLAHHLYRHEVPNLGSARPRPSMGTRP